MYLTASACQSFNNGQIVTLFCMLLLGAPNIHCLFTKEENMLLVIQKKKITITHQSVQIKILLIGGHF